MIIREKKKDGEGRRNRRKVTKRRMDDMKEI